jgi:hypothetical protein
MFVQMVTKLLITFLRFFWLFLAILLILLAKTGSQTGLRTESSKSLTSKFKFDFEKLIFIVYFTETLKLSNRQKSEKYK